MITKDSIIIIIIIFKLSRWLHQLASSPLTHRFQELNPTVPVNVCKNREEAYHEIQKPKRARAQANAYTYVSITLLSTLSGAEAASAGRPVKFRVNTEINFSLLCKCWVQRVCLCVYVCARGIFRDFFCVLDCAEREVHKWGIMHAFGRALLIYSADLFVCVA